MSKIEEILFNIKRSAFCARHWDLIEKEDQKAIEQFAEDMEQLFNIIHKINRYGLHGSIQTPAEAELFDKYAIPKVNQ